MVKWLLPVTKPLDVVVVVVVPRKMSDACVPVVSGVVVVAVVVVVTVEVAVELEEVDVAVVYVAMTYVVQEAAGCIAGHWEYKWHHPVEAQCAIATHVLCGQFGA